MRCAKSLPAAETEKRVHRINQVALVYKWGNLLVAKIFWVQQPPSIIRSPTITTTLRDDDPPPELMSARSTVDYIS